MDVDKAYTEFSRKSKYEDKQWITKSFQIDCKKKNTLDRESITHQTKEAKHNLYKIKVTNKRIFLIFLGWSNSSQHENSKSHNNVKKKKTEDTCNLSKYRPISLLPEFFKFLEKLFDNRRFHRPIQTALTASRGLSRSDRSHCGILKCRK